MEYKGFKLFGTDNIDKEPVEYMESGQYIFRHDNGERVDLVACPSCGMVGLCRVVCQFCGQRFKEEAEATPQEGTENGQ